MKVMISGVGIGVRRNILFQSAVYWAEEGCKILYITKEKFENIPQSVHGPQVPSPEVLAKLGMVYIDTTEELLKFLADILTFRDTAPRVILLEGLEEYCAEGDQIAARVCALLCHVSECCMAQCDAVTHLLVTNVTFPTPITCAMFDTLWTFDSDALTLTKTLPIESRVTTRLSLATRADGALVLRQVEHLFNQT